MEIFTLSSRMLNAIKSLAFYLIKILIPGKLIPFYPFPSSIYWLDLQYLLSALLILTITVFCLFFMKHKKYLFIICWVYYLITLLPVLGIIQVGGQAAADRYTYLPSLSIFLLIGTGFSWVILKLALSNRKIMLGGTVIIALFVIILLGRLTVKQIKIWHNPEIFWTYITEAFPYPESDPIVYYNLGNVYAKRNDLDRAITEYKKSLSLNPGYERAHNNLGTVYMLKGDLEKAISEQEKALSIDPGYEKAHNNLGTAYIKLGELDKSIAEYKKTIVINPDNAEAHNNLSVAYYYKKNYKLAILHGDMAIALGFPVDQALMEKLKPYR
jgi:tetratricopeptide (TPR) repeat protein